jgi:hypothetical protein
MIDAVQRRRRARETGPAASLRRRSRLLAIAVLGVAALALLRVLLAYASLPDVFYWEEIYRLTIAGELLAGPRWPIWDYQADHYQGGSLVVGLLATPVVALLGPAHEHLKLVPIAFATATAACWTLLLWRAAGPACGALGAWILALAPPTAQIYQVLAMGSHAETALFTVLGFLVTLEMLRGSRHRGLPFALGLVAGLGMWFCYTAASGVAACGLLWLAASPRGAVRRGLAPLAAGLLIGFSPWIAYNLAHDFSGLDRLAELFDPRKRPPAATAEALGSRLSALLGVDLPQSFGFPETRSGLPGPASWAYYALTGGALALLAGLAWRELRTRSPQALLAALIGASVILHMLAYLASAFRMDIENGFIGYRFLAPLFSVVAVSLKQALTRLFADGHRRAAVTAGMATLVLGVYGSAALLRERAATEVPPVDSGYSTLGLLAQRKYRDDPAEAARLLAELDAEKRARGFFGLGLGLRFDYELDGEWEKLVNALASCPDPADRGAVFHGIRWSAWQRIKSSRQLGNSGFRREHHQQVHHRMSTLLARLPEIERPMEAEAARLRMERRR